MKPELLQALRQTVGELGPLPAQRGVRYDLTRDFNKGEITQEAAKLIAVMAERGISEVLRFCLTGRPLTSKHGLKIAMRRFVAVTWLLHSEMLIGDDGEALSLKQLGDMPALDCTKCALSLTAKKFADRLGIHTRVQKRKGSKENYADAARAGWTKRRKRQARSR